MERATFAAGCFWGVEAAFSKVEGVISTKVGYTGGTLKDPTYKDVSTGSTGHAESIDIIFDESVITYGELLEVLWNTHDPTTKDSQGPDHGSQYRSAIFYHDDAQREAALRSREQLERSGKYDSTIKTEIVKASEFSPAEDYHQKYFQKLQFKR
ncbi:peptide-methionine (S)-S-oxide reductase MsrA [Methanococcoides burtonii]|uniref:Peptide methionine sulfoxide reductase MsrA n=1 Tax=Methanococcoides burtonii (strain DSM 6242 / NBRC 107633 / OCM 468 / ACE-M) TaxID=259564 RepID=MSRA_METBU|nr:peptide-methionine (S)-S-oxide reductase MsrA [Methanococcoides burtonii]Q12TP4.1 RecName: Full=Peptide methionine sulfoxide reductase MsrA; Short=Protein-methionine-S-oxide reductase; AltName: Full=Peptide-methionine (S)-S-oxide reductase; Short=Peptide Met(O) reductase [Methanococcoides burtonii DSM 6242]ABE53182.1 Peptide methionine-S-sulfoxide reductase [Methanococcoides burtonii DSM 6242]